MCRKTFLFTNIATQTQKQKQTNTHKHTSKQHITCKHTHTSVYLHTKRTYNAHTNKDTNTKQHMLRCTHTNTHTHTHTHTHNLKEQSEVHPLRSVQDGNLLAHWILLPPTLSDDTAASVRSAELWEAHQSTTQYAAHMYILTELLYSGYNPGHPTTGIESYINPI